MWTFVLGLILTGTAIAQDDDGLVNGENPAPNVAVNRVAIDVNQVDQWVFSGCRNAQEGRKRIDSQLKMRMNEINRICKLSSEQKQKLQLIASGDMQRFFDDFEAVRTKVLKNQNDRNGVNNIWQDISPLQQKFNAGLFDDQSLFAKSIRGTLDDQQREAFDRAALARRQFLFEAQVGAMVGMLERRMPLADAQRRQFIKLILDAGPPHKFGQYDQHVVWYFASRIPEETLRPLFDDLQWKVLKQQLDQSAGLEQVLRRERYID